MARVASALPVDELATHRRRLMELVSSHGGRALALMEDEGVTLPQLLPMSRVASLQRASISELMPYTPCTHTAVSQIVDRASMCRTLGKAVAQLEAASQGVERKS